MKRVEEDADWSIMCPAECPGLDNCWGKEFEDLYESYVARGKARRTFKARELWYAILDAQIETGLCVVFSVFCCIKHCCSHLLFFFVFCISSFFFAFHIFVSLSVCFSTSLSMPLILPSVSLPLSLISFPSPLFPQLCRRFSLLSRRPCSRT